MKFLELFRGSDSKFHRNLIIFLFAYFCVLFNYPLVRASSTTFFFEAFGAKSSPMAWLWSVLFLTLTVFTSNWLQGRWGVQKVFLLVSALSAGVFISGIFGMAYPPFIWKEIYIVLQVHLLLAYANAWFRKEDYRLLIGIVGGVGSIGGIIGGWLTSFIADRWGTAPVMGTGVVFVLMPALFFLFTDTIQRENTKKETPLASFTPGIGRYVALIGVAVALSQFIVNIADFNFHLIFEKSIAESGARTSYLGNVYMLTNAATFFLQFLVLPYLMPRVSLKNYHLFVPISYLISLLVLVLTPAAGVVAFATFFIYLKSSDYSLFSAGKELLYQPLTVNQKYGAKYLTDMLVYRVAKAMIAAVLIYLQTSTILNTLMVIFLLSWIWVIIKLFKIHRQLFN